MTDRRPALIFDFGNVVAFFDYARACGRLGARIGLSGEQLLARLRERGFTPLLHRFEHGQIDAETYAAAVIEASGVDIPVSTFLEDWADIFDLNEPVAALIPRLKAQGYPLVLGSNTNIIHAAFFQRRFAPTISLFDRLILSHEVGSMKPARAFYLACAEAAGVRPADCVFIDDMPENVRGAIEAGLQGWLFRDAPTLVRDLVAAGIVLDPPSPT